MTQTVKPMSAKELAETKRVIIDTIHRTMPSAVIIGQETSAVDISGMVQEAVDRHPPRKVYAWVRKTHGDSIGHMTGIRLYCAEHDLPVSDMFVKAFRHELIRTNMRESAELEFELKGLKADLARMTRSANPVGYADREKRIRQIEEKLAL